MQNIYFFLKRGLIAVFLLFLSQQTFAADLTNTLIYAPEGLTKLEILVQEQSNNGGQLDLTFALKITNNSSKSLQNLELNIISPSDGVTIIDNFVNVGSLASGSELVTADTFALTANLDQTGNSFKIHFGITMFDANAQDSIEDEALIEIHVE